MLAKGFGAMGASTARAGMGNAGASDGGAVRRRLAALGACAGLIISLLVFTSGAAEAADPTKRTVTLRTSASSVIVGQRVSFAGRVTKSPKGTRVLLQLKKGGRWRKVAATRTRTTSGTYRLVVTTKSSGRFAYRTWVARSRTKSSAASPVRRVSVYRRASATLAVSPRQATTGDSLRFSGTARPFRVGTLVRLQKKVGTSWRDDGAATTIRSQGMFAFTRSAVAGIVRYRAVVARTTNWIASATSGPVAVDTAGPASLEVQVLDVPAGTSPDVTVTAPDGSERTISDTTTIQRAAVGTWTITSAPVDTADGQVWPALGQLKVVVARGQSATAVVDYAINVPDTTQVVDTSHVQSVATGTGTNGDQTTITLDSAAGQQAEVGDVVAIGVSAQTPDGILGKVVERDGDQLILDTADVTLMDAISSASFDTSVTLGNGDVASASTAGEALRATVANGRLSTRSYVSREPVQPQAATPEPLSQRLAKAFSCDGDATAKADAELSVTPSIAFSATWDLLHGVTSAKATASVIEASSITATLAGSGQCTLDRVGLLPKPITFTPITFNVGPVPVVITPDLQFYVDGSAKADGKVEAGASQSYAVTAGLSYASGSFSPIASTTASRKIIGPTFAGEAHVDLGVAPEIRMLLYGLAGPRVYLRGSIEGDAKADADLSSATLDWSVGARLKAAAAVDVDKLKLHSGEKEVYNHLWPVASGHVGYTPPPAPEITTASLPDATVGEPYQATLHTADNRNGTWTIDSGTLPDGLALYGDTITGTPTTAGTSTITIGFTDTHEKHATAALTLRVVAGDTTPVDGTPWSRTLESPSARAPWFEWFLGTVKNTAGGETLSIECSIDLLSATGAVRRHIDPPGGTACFTDATLAPDGTLYATVVDGDRGGSLLSYASDGTERWSAAIDGAVAENAFLESTRVIVDSAQQPHVVVPDGSVSEWVVGFDADTGAESSRFLAWHASSVTPYPGGLVSVTDDGIDYYDLMGSKVASYVSSQIDPWAGWSYAVDPSGTVVKMGYPSDSDQQACTNLVISLATPNGQSWTRTVDGCLGSAAITQDGGVVVVRNPDEATGNQDVRVTNYSADGAVIWTRPIQVGADVFRLWGTGAVASDTGSVAIVLDEEMPSTWQYRIDVLGPDGDLTSTVESNAGGGDANHSLEGVTISSGYLVRIVVATSAGSGPDGDATIEATPIAGLANTVGTSG